MSTPNTIPPAAEVSNRIFPKDSKPSNPSIAAESMFSAVGTIPTTSKTAEIHRGEIGKPSSILSCDNREVTASPESWPAAAKHCVAEHCAAVSTEGYVKLKVQTLQLPIKRAEKKTDCQFAEESNQNKNTRSFQTQRKMLVELKNNCRESSLRYEKQLTKLREEVNASVETWKKTLEEAE